MDLRHCQVTIVKNNENEKMIGFTDFSQKLVPSYIKKK